MNIVGIVNITNDSFSDGGQFLGTDAAVQQAKKLLQDGADIIELSGASSNPRSAPVSAAEQIARMEPVLAQLDCEISIDAANADVQRWAIQKGVAYSNDIKGFPDSSIYPALAASNAKLVVMHSITNTEKAARDKNTVEQVMQSLYAFFEKRIPELVAAGISRDRIIIDPGMGFFLSSDPAPSYAVLDDIPDLKEKFGLPVMISVSRKSFLREGNAPQSPETAAKSLDLELYAIRQGAEYIRTHEVKNLRRSLRGNSMAP